MDPYSNSSGYGQLIQYPYSTPNQSVKAQTLSIGKTLLGITGLLAAGIIVGMGLGLGLGIGAAGLVGSVQLVNVTNTTTISTG
ncbi:unnamed protein product [Adineta steineri]|uniref:Uncharacterized protein n=1 Tax=Adineta steineri TaxID=433720 RepID=A0A814PLC7_9BILA|nr:unnamed protein product [Adineta steineri]CAF1041986.1 unnamed protein product [Adineta steineri]CAF1107603.1 unnamed protein product [Adineta steineri]CAF3670782.1 unnamed protein product [Adineta steineri]CAF3677064.1 unnamed protein product [Adineta steineri]